MSGTAKCEVLLTLISCFLPLACAESVVLRSSPAVPIEVTSVRANGRNIPAVAQQIEPSPQLIAIAAPGLGPQELEELKRELSAQYQTRRSKFRLGILGAGGIALRGPFRNRSMFLAALRDLDTASGTGTAPGAGDLYGAICAGLNGIAEPWSSVVVAGRFPDIEPALERYAMTYVLASMMQMRVRLSFWIPEGVPAPTLLQVVAPLTGGGRGFSAPESSTYIHVTWHLEAPAHGFALYDAKLQPAGMTVPSVRGAGLPSLVDYATLRKTVEHASDLFASKKLTPNQFAELQADIQTALRINPSDEGALRLGCSVYSRLKDHTAAARLLGDLLELKGETGALRAQLGNEQYLAGQFDAAEHNLARAVELKTATFTVDSELGHLHLRRHDDRGAIPYLERALQANSEQQDLWFLLAGAYRNSGDWTKQAESLERGLAVGGVHLDSRATLVRLYLAHKDAAGALRQARAALPLLPKDVSIRSIWAALFEQLKDNDVALQLWNSVLAIDPAKEPAYYGAASILAARKRLSEALEMAGRGLSEDDTSTRLHLLKVSILEQQGGLYEARQALRDAVKKTDDLQVLTAYAEMEDQFGRGAPEAYARVIKAALKQGADSDTLRSLAERGWEVSLRENDEAEAKWFSDLCQGLHAGVSDTLAPAPAASGTTGVWVPGGFDALAFIAHAKPGAAPDRFLTEYARAVLTNTSGADVKAIQAYRATVRDYFDRLHQLTALASQQGLQLVVTVSLTGKKDRQRTQKLLDLLGWKLRKTKEGVSIESGEKRSQAKRQDFASALAIDQAGMSRAFESGKSFQFPIPYEWAPIVRDEKLWRDEFYGKQNLSGGLPEAMALDLGLAQVYVGLSEIDQNTASALLSGLGLHTLAEKYGGRFSTFASALSVSNGRVAVPGGPAAETFWAELVGVSPADPAQFLRSLIENQGGMLLRWYYMLSELDAAHQRFFTLNQKRLSSFYQLFQEFPEARKEATYEAPFSDFLWQVPLDAKGRVAFPGSPEAWMVVKGRSARPDATDKFIKRAHTTVAPDLEDEILLRLARTRYKVHAERGSELDNFLAVVHIEAHRKVPLDEASAIALAQGYVEFAPFYAYFAALPDLSQPDFLAFFRFGEKLRNVDKQSLNDILGQFDSLLELLRIASQAGVLNGKQSSEAFFQLCDGFSRAATMRDYTLASLSAIRLLTGGNVAPPRASVVLRALLIGDPVPFSIDINGIPRVLDRRKLAERDFDRVLDLQKAPAIQNVLELATIAQEVSGAGGISSDQLRALEISAGALPNLELPKNAKMDDTFKKEVLSSRPLRIRELVAQLQRKAAKKKQKRKDYEAFSGELLEALGPQMRLALSGLIYARYFRSSDLLVADDPFFLRKHLFTKVSTPPQLLPDSEIELSGEGSGSYLEGGFDRIGYIAGRVASASTKRSGENTEYALIYQIGAIRTTDWRHYDDHVQHLAALKITVAKEWCVEAARNPDLLNDLAEDTLGLLSLQRRRELIGALSRHEWRAAWKAITLPDLYFLGDRFLRRYRQEPWHSPTVAAIRAASGVKDTSALNVLGPIVPDLYGCSEPHMIALAPFEEYARRAFPGRISERTAFFKLYLADLLDTLNLAARAAAVVAEPAARDLLSRASLADDHDWRGIVEVFSKLNDSTVHAAIKDDQ